MASLKKNAFWITGITLISKIIGFGREMAMAHFFGATFIIDAYLMAVAIPSILFGGVLNSISVTFVPVYTEINERMGKKQSNEFTSNISLISLILSIAATVLGLLFTDEIVRILASGFKGETYDLTVKFLRISFFALIAMVLRNIFVSFLHCNNRYITEKISSLAFTLINFIVVIISGFFNYNFLIYGYTMGYFVFMILIIFNSKTSGYKFSFKLEISDNIKNVFYLAVPVFVGSMAGQINLLVDKTIASRLKEGSISSLNYASVVNSFVFSLVTVAMVTIIYPVFSKKIARNDIGGFKDTLIKGLNFLIIFLVPITVGSIILAKPAIVFIYERGAFGSSATEMTYTAFIFYAVGILAVGIKSLMIKAFYSLKETKKPMVIGFISVGINIGLNIILVRYMEHNGLALATSITAIVTVFPLTALLRKKIGPFTLLNSTKLFLKSVFSSIIMGVLVYFIYRYISPIIGIGFLKEFITILITVILGAAIYFAVMKVIKAKELKYIEDLIKK
jgi:putative peptidoglycan lipid II flippase